MATVESASQTQDQSVREPPVGTEGVETERVVHNSVYLDPRVYDAETERIFKSTWTFVCHETDLPEVGDYLTKQVAGNPILAVRAKDGQIHVLYNVCRHRGATVLQGEGHTEVMRCPYHWWTYDLDGRLKGVPGKIAYEGTGFEMENFGLVAVRVESMFGLIFACPDTSAPGLREYVGDRPMQVLEKPFGSLNLEVIHRSEFRVKANWKMVAENQMDGYHVPFVHPIFRAASPPQPYENLENGHCVQWLKTDESRLPDQLQGKATGHVFPGFEDFLTYLCVLFPDLNITIRPNFAMISSSTPVDRNETLVERRIFGIVGDSEEQRQVRLTAAHALALDTYSGEDMPVLEAQAEGLSNWTVPYSLIARGEKAMTGTRGDDNRLRHWWAAWRQAMGAEKNASPWLEG